MTELEKSMNLTSRIALVGAGVLGVALVPVAANAHSPQLTDQQRQQIVSRFATAIVHDDHRGIIANTTAGVTWTIPGTSAVSGRSVGQNAVLKLADTFAKFDLTISPRAFAFGVDTVAVELHDTGSHNGKALDQDVVNVLTIRDGKVSSLSGNLADVQAFDAYFS